MIKPEDFLELVMTRQSDRGYLDKPVEKEKIMRCVEAARLAPSACNSQPWKFIVVDDVEKKNALADYSDGKIIPMNHFTKQAPVHVVIVQEKANFTSAAGQIIKNKDYPLMDIGIAAEHFCLQAKTEGLGTCMLGWFNEKKVKQLLNIPRNKRAELIITVGYPSSDEIRAKRRKDIDDICVFNDYNGNK